MDSTRELLQSQYDQELLFADGFDEVIIGVSANVRHCQSRVLC